MNKRQSNKLNSFRRVKGVLKKKSRIFGEIPVYTEPLDTYFSQMDEIEHVVKRTGSDTTGETKRKNGVRLKMCELAISLASSGLIYAYDIASPELRGALEYTLTDITHARDNDTLMIVMAIEEELNIHAEALVEYQVSADDLSALHALIEQFKNSAENQGDVKTESVAETRRFEVLLNAIEELLTQKIDRIVRRVKTDNPKFFDQYQTARMIIDL